MDDQEVVVAETNYYRQLGRAGHIGRTRTNGPPPNPQLKDIAMEAASLTPQCGDVLFTSSPGLERAVSLWVQRKVDPLAKVAERGFTHVAIAMNDGMAVEAVPAPLEGDDIISRIVALKEAKDKITRTPWSDVELDFGVRPFPIEEICVGSLNPGCDLAVLRSEANTSEAAKFLDLQSPFILALIGSEYSIDPLHKSMEGEIHRAQAALLKIGPEWTSRAADLKSRLNLSEAEWKLLDKWAPDALPDCETRPYFCSQLVPMLLERAGLLANGSTAPNVTPTGLFKALAFLGWKDVTVTDYDRTAALHLRDDTLAAASCAQSFTFWKVMIAMERRRLALNPIPAAVGGALQEVRDRLDGLTPRLQQSRKSDGTA